MSVVYDLLRSHPFSGRRLIGIEVERFLVRGNRPLRYESEVRELLEKLVADNGWKSSYEVDGKILAISKKRHAISIEPGGQFEVSSGPQESVAALKKVKDEIDAEISPLLGGDVRFLCAGLNPWEVPEDIPLLPSPRYALMNKHFEATGKRGKEMMRLSLGLQVNLDIDGEKEAADMLRGGFYCAPALSAMFSNSPYSKGKKTDRLSDRHFVWRDTDPARQGFPEFVFEEGFDLKSYAAFISRTPLMYAYDKDGHVWDPKGKSLDQLDSGMREANALSAVRQMFTEVRLKPCCVEVRCLDQVEDDERYAATGLVAGLLYDEENRRWLNKKFAGVKAARLAEMMKVGAQSGLRDEEVYRTAKEFLSAAEKGLVRRGLGEENFLGPAERIVETRKVPAESLSIEL
jgi:glutamate--cysteine ligase